MFLFSLFSSSWHLRRLANLKTGKHKANYTIIFFLFEVKLYMLSLFTVHLVYKTNKHGHFHLHFQMAHNTPKSNWNLSRTEILGKIKAEQCVKLALQSQISKKKKNRNHTFELIHKQHEISPLSSSNRKPTSNTTHFVRLRCLISVARFRKPNYKLISLLQFHKK